MTKTKILLVEDDLLASELIYSYLLTLRTFAKKFVKVTYSLKKFTFCSFRGL